MSAIFSASTPRSCMLSATIANGVAVCENAIVFEENFNSLSMSTWSHVVRIPRRPVSKFKFVILW